MSKAEDEWDEGLQAPVVFDYGPNFSSLPRNRGGRPEKKGGGVFGEERRVDRGHRHYESSYKDSWTGKGGQIHGVHSNEKLKLKNSYSNSAEKRREYLTSNDAQRKEQSDSLIDWGALIQAAEEEEIKIFSHLPKVVLKTYFECEDVKNLTNKEVDSIRQSKNQITVSSLDDTKPTSVPNPVSKFNHSLHPYPELLQIIENQGFQQPSPIQCQLWPLLMSGFDVVGIAQTGTGKTLAYLLPGLLHIDAQPFFRDPHRNGPLCLIIAPTRELAQQIQDEAVKFRYKGMKSVCVYGQGNYGNQCKALRSGVEIIVATPGRLIDFVSKDIVNLTGVSYLVLDEADRMLDMGFQPDILKITTNIRKDRQTVLTSATWPPDVEYIAKRLMRNPIKVRVGQLDLAAVATVTQDVRVCEEEEKIAMLLEMLHNLAPNDKVIVFCNKKAMVDYLAVNLLDDNVDARVMHGGVDQCDRESALEDLKKGVCRVLLATDVASRGLDVSDLTLVINLDLPKNLEEYVHRSGRTGRAGRTGQVVSFVTWENRNQAQELIDILQRSNQEIPSELQRLADRAKRFRENRPTIPRRKTSDKW